MTAHPDSTQPQDEREIRLDRIFDAPRELVFEAWTRREHIGQWWGPNGFTTTTYEMDVRPGGVWRFMMHGPDGTDYPNRIVYEEVVPAERLVYAHGDFETTLFHVTVTFTVEGGRTRVRMRLLFPTAEARDYVVREHGAIEGGRQTLGRLEQYLATLRG